MVTHLPSTTTVNILCEIFSQMRKLQVFIVRSLPDFEKQPSAIYNLRRYFGLIGVALGLNHNPDRSTDGDFGINRGI